MEYCSLSNLGNEKHSFKDTIASYIATETSRDTVNTNRNKGVYSSIYPALILVANKIAVVLNGHTAKDKPYRDNRVLISSHDPYQESDTSPTICVSLTP